MKYIKFTSNTSIVFKRTGNRQLMGYSDADWATDIGDRKSITGSVFILAGGPISWTSKKQTSISHSSTAAEYTALSHAAREAFWLSTMLRELRQSSSKVPIYCDSQGTIKLLKNPIINSGSKHIDISHHGIRDYLARDIIEILPINTTDMLADGLTKPLNGRKSREHAVYMGLEFHSSTLLPKHDEGGY
jgi:hypothetical protein